MFSSTKMQNNFMNLITKFGKSYTLTRYTKTDVLIDPLRPTKGHVITSTTTDVTGYASTYDRKLINSESLIELTDFPLFVSGAGLTFSSDKSDKISDGIKTFSIIDITDYGVGTDTIFYEIQLRS